MDPGRGSELVTSSYALLRETSPFLPSVLTKTCISIRKEKPHGGQEGGVSIVTMGERRSERRCMMKGGAEEERAGRHAAVSRRGKSLSHLLETLVAPPVLAPLNKLFVHSHSCLLGFMQTPYDDFIHLIST